MFVTKAGYRRDARDMRAMAMRDDINGEVGYMYVGSIRSHAGRRLRFMLVWKKAAARDGGRRHVKEVGARRCRGNDCTVSLLNTGQSIFNDA
jgi:hypothetical protein